MNETIIPKLGSVDCQKKHEENIEVWKLFARRIQRNPFVLQKVLERDGTKCAWCFRPSKSQFLLHHIDYDHECNFVRTITLHTPTVKRPNRTTTVPDCQSCSVEKPEYFHSCLKRVVAVHQWCNKEIESCRGGKGEQLSFDL